MPAADDATFEHPLRSRNDVPRSDVRRASASLAEAMDAMLAAHAPAAGNAGEKDSKEKQRVIEELTRCAGGNLGITDIAVGDVLIRFTCGTEADAATISAAVNHTGITGKAAWFKGADETAWGVVVIPSR